MKKLFVIILIIMFVFITGCFETTRLAVRDPKFELTKVVLCSEMPIGYKQYILLEDGTYNWIEMVYVYIEFENPTIRKDEYGKHIWIVHSRKLSDLKGNVYLDGEVFSDKDYEYDQAPYMLYYLNPRHQSISLKGGIYTIEFKAIDMYSGWVSMKKVNFRLVSGWNGII